jgi:type I restriction enzyme M protein
MEIKSEFLRELQGKVNCQKNILDIVKCALDLENNLNEEVQNYIKENVNRTNIIDFYEMLIYTGGLGEFYTPKCLSDLVNKLTGDVQGIDVYEPTIGSGNLVTKFYENNNIYGQEFNEDTYEITKLLLPNATLEQGDTLSNDKFEDKKFDLIISNPPYGGSGWTPFEHEKFQPAPVNKKEIESAFIQHNIWHLNDNGKAIMILPHGCLFRGNKEGKMREYILSNNWLECIIGVPSNLFSNTGIPVQIMIFNKAKTTEDILFIDASKEFTKVKKLNVLDPEHIDKIVNCYLDKTTIDKFSRMVTIEEIKDNDYNLNIPRYVDTFEEEEPIDIDLVHEKISKLNKDIFLMELQVAAQLNDLFEEEKESNEKTFKDKVKTRMGIDIQEVVSETEVKVNDEVVNFEQLMIDLGV